LSKLISSVLLDSHFLKYESIDFEAVFLYSI